jgi:hypothetical protein
MLVGVPDILNEVYRGFTRFLQANVGLDDDVFLPNPCQSMTVQSRAVAGNEMFGFSLSVGNLRWLQFVQGTRTSSEISLWVTSPHGMCVDGAQVLFVCHINRPPFAGFRPTSLCVDRIED